MDKKQGEYNITPAEIDDHILKLAGEGNILKGMTDQAQINRVMLNCFCELLAQAQHLSHAFDNFNEVLSICSMEKMNDFFTKSRKNFEKEKKRVEENTKKAKNGKKV